MNDIEKAINTIQTNKGVLYILCGYPYAGKSYISQQILKGTDAVFMSIDDIFHSHGFDWDANILPNAEQWRMIFDESYERTKEALKEGKNVLYDSTNQTFESREKLREIARSVGADSRVLFVSSPEDTVWKRWQENIENRSRPVVSRELVQQTIAAFEPPTEQEQVLVIKN